METIWHGLFQTLAVIGFFDVILPFVLIFTILFRALEHSKVLAGQTNERQINTMVAFSISFLAIASGQIVTGISVIAVYSVMALLAMIFFAIIMALLGVDAQAAHSGFWVITLALGVALFLFFADVVGFNRLSSVLDFLVPVVLIAAIFSAFVWWITRGEPNVKKEKKAKKKEKNNKQVQPDNPFTPTEQDILAKTDELVNSGVKQEELVPKLLEAGFTIDEINEYNKKLLSLLQQDRANN